MAEAFPANSRRLRAVPSSPFWFRQAIGFPDLQTSLIGREREVAALLRLLRKPTSRLLTLMGAGGIGKTRLAIAAATAGMAGFADGAVFVSLADITDPSRVLSAIARVLDIPETLERPLADTLRDALRPQRLLIVLDNFEHVLPAAADVDALLEACPGLTVFVTSRSPLRLDSERRVPTPPLTLPDIADDAHVASLAASDAVALFVARARAVSPMFALDAGNAEATAEICRRLDGLPLAIELAAAWVRVLPPAALLARLEQRLGLLYGGAEDQPLRLQTMREAIRWSYDLLGEDEARLFRRLAVFVGGFSLEAAEDVGGQGEGSGNTTVLDVLARLVDRSLVQTAHVDGRVPRYQMLETVREFALERLAERHDGPQAAVWHAAYFLALAEQAEPHLLGPDEQQWHVLLDAELANLRAALSWSLAHDVEMTLRIGAALWAYWGWSQVAEGRRWLTAALDRSTDVPDVIRARALSVAGALAALEGNFAVCLALGDAGIEAARASGDAVAEARARWVTGCAYFYRGSADGIGEAIPELDRSLRLFEQAATTTDRAWAAYARSIRAIAASLLGDIDEGEAQFEEALTRARAAHSDGITLAILSDFAAWLLDRGRPRAFTACCGKP